MRLLNADSLRLEFFLGLDIPEYAILSHTWGEEEVLFEDMHDPARPLPTQKNGFAKLEGSCAQARRDGYKYIWIDTCCIDKSSSAELSESINSMFQWYQKSARCYAFLDDVNDDADKKRSFGSLEKSRWFKRGWTLQELIAPRDVRFYDEDWSCMGTRGADINGDCSRDLAERISLATGIPVKALHWYSPREHESHVRSWKLFRSEAAALATSLDSFSVAQRMSWAAGRRTTRVEDEAYSLLGLFGVNMPLLYGEGRRAFFRLQQEILRTSNDQSILACVRGFTELWIPCPLLADSPQCFMGSDIEPPSIGAPRWATDGESVPATTPLSPSARTLEISVCLCPLEVDPPWQGSLPLDGEIFFAILDCAYGTDCMSHPAIVLKAIDESALSFVRVNGFQVRRTSPLDLVPSKPSTATINPGPWFAPWDELTRMVLPPNLDKATFKTVRLHFYPPPQRAPHPRGPFDFARLDEVAPGMEIRFGSGAASSPSAVGGYPQSAEAVGDMQRIYFSSANTRRWLRDKVQRGENDEIPAADMGFPFGVVILRFRLSHMKTLVASWGQPPPGPKGSKAWFTAMCWTSVAARCGLGQAPDSEPDLVSAAKVIFDKYDTWIGLVEMDSTGFVIELDESPGKIRFAIDERDFFGRPFLSVNMTVEGVDVDHRVLKELTLRTRSTGTERPIPRLKIRGGGRSSPTQKAV